jgi:predicted MPP superfamily phosphohydrolase
MPWAFRMLLVIFPWVLLAYIYTGYRLYTSFGQFSSLSKKWILIIISCFILYLNSYPIIVLILNLSGKSPEILMSAPRLAWTDYVFVFPYWWGLVLTVETLPYFIGIDIILLLTLFLKKLNRQILKQILAYSRISLMAGIFVYSGIRIYHDTYFVKRSEHYIYLKDLPESLDGLSITLLGDIQVDRYTQQTKIDKLLDAVNQKPTDILLFAGDLVTYGQRYINQGLDLMCHLSAEQARIACLGDHDYWANPTKIEQGFTRCGWDFLMNSYQIINFNNKRILITGLTNIYSKRLSGSVLKSLLQNGPDADLKLLLVHQPSPEIIEAAARYGYDIVFAGHTHGGQIRFHPFGIEITPSMFETHFYSGIYVYKNLKVVVTNGVGLTFAPIRYAAPAEVTVVYLNKK